MKWVEADLRVSDCVRLKHISERCLPFASKVLIGFLQTGLKFQFLHEETGFLVEFFIARHSCLHYEKSQEDIFISAEYNGFFSFVSNVITQVSLTLGYSSDLKLISYSEDRGVTVIASQPYNHLYPFPLLDTNFTISTLRSVTLAQIFSLFSADEIHSETVEIEIDYIPQPTKSIRFKTNSEGRIMKFSEKVNGMSSKAVFNLQEILTCLMTDSWGDYVEIGFSLERDLCLKYRLNGTKTYACFSCRHIEDSETDLMSQQNYA